MDFFLQAFTKGWKRAFDYKGRMKRAEFWSFFSASIALAAVLFIGLIAIHENLLWVGFIYFSAFMVPYFSAIVRRIRDTGQPLWWLLVSLVPYIGGLVLYVLLFMPSADKEQVAEAA